MFAQTINERDSWEYETTLLDEDGAAVTLVSLTTLTLTLYDEATGTVLNSRSAVDVKNANGGTFHATTGLFTMAFTAADGALLSTSLRAGQAEVHRASFVATWASGAKRKSWEIQILVVNLAQVT